MPVKIRLKNFQAYESAEVEVRGLTAVAGPNNGGKSSVARAVRAAFQNLPSAHLVRRGASQMEVEVDLGDFQFTWGRGTGGKNKGRPTYQVGGSTVFPGKEVPDEVKRVGIRPVEIGGEAVWPQLGRQGEAAFLVDRSGAYLAEAVCDPGRAELLAQAGRLLQGDQRGVRARLQEAREHLGSARRWLAFLGPAEPSAQDALRVAAEVVLLEQDLARVAALCDLRDRIRLATERVAKLSVLLGVRLPDAEGLRARMGALQRSRTLREQIERVGNQVRTTRAVVGRVQVPAAAALADLRARYLDLIQVRGRLRDLQVRCAKKPGPMVMPDPSGQVVLLKVPRSLESMRGLKSMYAVAEAKVATARSAVYAAQGEVRAAEASRTELVRSHLECPLCGSAPDQPRQET